MPNSLSADKGFRQFKDGERIYIFVNVTVRNQQLTLQVYGHGNIGVAEEINDIVNLITPGNTTTEITIPSTPQVSMDNNQFP